MSLPIELYGEIFTYLDFLTALRFRSVCKAFGKFHTAATREHSEVRSITEAIDLKKTEVIKAMAKANLPLIRANSDTIIQRMAFGLDDVEIFMSVVWAADRTTQNDFRIYLATAQIFCAFTIAGYIIYSGLLEDVSDDSDNEYDSDVEWLCNGDYN